MQLEDQKNSIERSGELIEATATVVAVDGRMAVLETKRTNACSGCGASGACGTSALGQIFGRKQNMLQIENDFDAIPGEQVVIGLPEGDLLLASLAAYMLPLVAMLGFALLGLGAGYGDGVAALLALGGFGLGIWGAQRYAQRAGARFTPRFVRRAGFGFETGSCGK